MNRTCPVCGGKVTISDIFRAAFNDNGKPVVCRLCSSVISKPWSEYRSLGSLGVGLGGILGVTNWYLRDFFGGDTSWMYWTLVLAVFAISLIVSAAFLYYWFPLNAAFTNALQPNQRPWEDIKTHAGNSQSSETAENNLTPSGMEWAPHIRSGGELAGRLVLLALLIVLLLLAGYLLVFRDALFPAVLVIIAATLLDPDIKILNALWKPTIICLLVFLALAQVHIPSA